MRHARSAVGLETGVEQMSGRWKIKNDDIRKLALRARDAHDPTLVQYVWVPRADNSRADALANEMLDLALGGGADHIQPHRYANAEDVVGDVKKARAEPNSPKQWRASSRRAR